MGRIAGSHHKSGKFRDVDIQIGVFTEEQAVWDELIVAIIMQAMRDYKNCQKKGETDQMNSLRKWLSSQICGQMIPNLDLVYIADNFEKIKQINHRYNRR